MYNFNSILEKSSKNLEKSLIFSEYGAQPLLKLVKQYYLSHPQASNKEVYEYFRNFFAKINLDIASLQDVKSRTLEYNTCKYLNRNEQARKEIFDEVMKEEKENPRLIESVRPTDHYTSNRRQSCRLMTINALKEIEDYKNRYSDEERKEYTCLFNLSKKEQANQKRILSAENRRSMEFLRIFFSGDRYSQLSNFLKRCEPDIEQNLRESYISSLITIGDNLKQFGVLENYFQKQERIWGELKMKGLTYPLREDEDGIISIESLFRRENLEKLTLSQLSGLNAVWINRLTKELESMNKAFFIIKKLDLLDEIKSAVPIGKKAYISLDIDEENLKSLYKKMNFLHEVANRVFKEAGKDEYTTVVEVVTQNGEKRSYKKTEITPILQSMNRDIGKKYNYYFNENQPHLEHDFITDIEDYRIMENVTHNTYKIKDMNILAILSNLYENGYSKNWGIIPEKKSKNSKYMLLAFDIEGLNMPVRLHVEKDLVRDFVKGYQNNTLFPIYEGADDLVDRGNTIGTQVLMPICQKIKIALLELMQNENHPYRNLLEHIQFLVDGTYPEHLKVETVMRKKGKLKMIKKIPPKRFMDLDTGEEFVDNNGEIINVSTIKDSNEGRIHE